MPVAHSDTVVGRRTQWRRKEDEEEEEKARACVTMYVVSSCIHGTNIDRAGDWFVTPMNNKLGKRDGRKVGRGNMKGVGNVILVQKFTKNTATTIVKK